MIQSAESLQERNFIQLRTIIEIDLEIALRDIKNEADCLMMLAVYEEKVKEGVNIKKVRLVANGKTQKQVGETYAATPYQIGIPDTVAHYSSEWLGLFLN